MPPQEERDPVFMSAMREMSRGHFAKIWQLGQAHEPLSSEDATIYQAMLEHAEYHDVWENASELADRDVEVDGVNPFLHVSLHTVIQRQLDDNNPPETAQTLFRLMHHGLDRHEALHRIAGVVVESLRDIMEHRRPFDLATYRRRLRAIKP